MNKFKSLLKGNWLLIFIILLAFTLRFWKLDSYPAFNADEAAIGYNVYSLIKTGLDEHGNSWPIHFQSFNDYKPGLYFYLVLPFVKVLGLNEWAVRIPGALLGVLTVLVVYFLVKELFKDKKYLAHIAAFFLAISPWHIHFSRGGWEVNVGTFFITLGLWLFIKAVGNKKYYLWSLISFVASLYTYHSARIVAPLLGLGLLIFYWKEVKNNLKSFIVALVISIALLIPLGLDLVKPAAISRAAGVGLFADSGPLSRINEQRGEHSNFLSLFPKVMHNKAVNYGLAFLSNWAAHYHGEFLFLSGDSIQRNKVPETGQMYLFDILLIVVGLIYMIKNFDRSSKVVVFWLFVAPIASALTFQSPHALRSHNMVIPLVIISSLGLATVIDWLKEKTSNKQLLKLSFILIGSIIVWSFARYMHMYWVHMAKEYPYSSQYGLKELVNYVKGAEDKYQKIWITDRYDQPYILFLFYSKYSPELFQGGHVLTDRDKYGFSTVRDFGKYHFEEVKFDVVKPENPNSLIVGTVEDIPIEANIVKTIYGTNGYPYFRVVAN